MKRVISALLAAFIIVITTIITTPVLALETQTPDGSTIVDIRVHPDPPLVEHMPLINLLSLELDFRNNGSNIIFEEGRIRYLDKLGNEFIPEVMFTPAQFEAAVGLRAGGTAVDPSANPGLITTGQRLILFFPIEELGSEPNVVPAAVEVDLFFEEFPDDPLRFLNIEIEEYHVPPGQSYIYPTGFSGVPAGEIWLSGAAHELGSAHRKTLRFKDQDNTDPVLWVNQRYAYDIDLRDLTEPDPRCHTDCTLNVNFFAWEEPVHAMAEGEVVLILQGNADNVMAGTPPGVNSCGAAGCDNEPDAGLCDPSDPTFMCDLVTCPDLTIVTTFPGSGNQVVLLHPNGEYSTYAHMMNTSNDHLDCGPNAFVNRGDVIGKIGMTGNGSNTHHHFTTIKAPGPEALLAENYPIYFNNAKFKTTGQTKAWLQLDTSLPKGTFIDAFLPAPAPIPPNPPDGPGNVMETLNPNNFLFQHQNLNIPASVEGVAETGDGAEIAVRGDGIEDIYRTDLASASTLQVNLFGPGHNENLDVYVLNDDNRVLNPTWQGTSPTATETVCLTAEAGAYYMLVSNVDQNPSAPADYTLNVSGALAPVLTVPGNLNIGDVCQGDTVTATLNVCNTGGDTESCHMDVEEISSSNGQFTVAEPSSGYPVAISSDFCFPFQVTFSPIEGIYGPYVAELTIPSNDPLNPEVEVTVIANVPEPDLKVAIAAPGDFGVVCKGDQKDLDVTLFNQGMCDLTISDMDLVPNDGSFELPSVLIPPLKLSHDAEFTLPVRYSPDTCSDSPETRTLKITSDDPDETMVNIIMSGVSPCPNLVIDPTDLVGIHAFPTTVVDSTGTLGCYTDRTVTLRNNANCPLTITSIAAAGDSGSGNAAAYSVITPSVVTVQNPIILPTGEETLEVTLRFTPQADDNPLAPSEVTGLMTVMSDDPDSDHTADLCGESAAQSGLRVLVTNVSSPTPIPVDEIDSLTVQSKGKNRPGPINLQFVDHPLSTDTVCGNDIFWHVDQETLPSTETTGGGRKSSYQTKAMEGNLQATESFGLGQCEFREFQLELQDSTSDICLGLPKGAICSNAGECCSGKCKGPSGGKTCK